MKDTNVLLVSIDSLRRELISRYDLQPAGFEFRADTPNIDAFAEKAATFESHFAGSLPCMPARREWMTGIQEFLWRPWGPIEPFDEPLPRLARDAGAMTKLITDHYHYFEHGSHGYYEDFNGFDFIRGHEWDAWKTSPKYPSDEGFLEQLHAGDPADLDMFNRTVYSRNTQDFDSEEDWFAARVFSKAAEWVRNNQDWEQWFLYVDSFDVHEPLDVPEPYASMYTDEDPNDPELTVWPYYGPIDEGMESQHWMAEESSLTDCELDFIRAQFEGKATYVDHWFGKLIDSLTETDAWEDTTVIVTSDHGFYVGDHRYVGKPYAPIYDTLAHTPLMIWHPESQRMGDKLSALTSAVDVYATVLESLGSPVPSDCHSKSVMPLLRGDTEATREYALYGYWGSSINVTDGDYTYLRQCRQDVDPSIYSSMQLNTAPEALQPPSPRENVETGQFLPYTDAMIWRYPEEPYANRTDSPLLFDIDSDPNQQHNIAGSDHEERMIELLVRALRDLEAPDEQFERVGIDESLY